MLGADTSDFAGRDFEHKYFRATVNRDTAEVLENYFRRLQTGDELIAACRAREIDDVGFINLCIAMRFIGANRQDDAMEHLRQAKSEPRDRWSGGIADAIMRQLQADRHWPFVEDFSSNDAQERSLMQTQ
jgi:hypothetical protein